jgi:hypothetical protein
MNPHIHEPILNAQNIKYALIIDDCMQMLVYLIKYYERDFCELGNGKLIRTEYKTINYRELPKLVEQSEFINNIWSRDLNFRNRVFFGLNNPMDTYAGWSISEKEYDRILSLITLNESYENFIKLSKYP